MRRVSFLYGILILGALLTMSCREEIQVDLKEATGRYIITAQIDNHFGTSVSVQETIGYFSEKNFNIVQVKDFTASVREKTTTKWYDLKADKRKVYSRIDAVDSFEMDIKKLPAEDFVAKLNETYVMEVEVAGKTYTAEIKMPEEALKHTTDASKYTVKDDDFENRIDDFDEKNFGKKLYEVKYEYAVDLGKNYGRVYPMKDQTYMGGFGGLLLAPNTLVSSDKEKQREYTHGLFDKEYPDTELCFISMGYASYRYFGSLSFSAAGPGSAKNPGNPQTNWKEGGKAAEVEGYFTAVHIKAYPFPPAPKK